MILPLVLMDSNVRHLVSDHNVLSAHGAATLCMGNPPEVGHVAECTWKLCQADAIADIKALQPCQKPQRVRQCFKVAVAQVQLLQPRHHLRDVALMIAFMSSLCRFETHRSDPVCVFRLWSVWLLLTAHGVHVASSILRLRFYDIFGGSLQHGPWDHEVQGQGT